MFSLVPFSVDRCFHSSWHAFMKLMHSTRNVEAEAVNFFGSRSGSALMKEVGSELGSQSVEKELERKQFFQNQVLPDFQTGYNRWGKM